jgi:mRNA export factor
MALFGTPTTTATSSSSIISGDISKDVALNQPPDDSISALAFSPSADFLAVSSWDKRLRIYEVSEQGQSQGKAEMTFDGPVLNCAWSPVSFQSVSVTSNSCA